MSELREAEYWSCSKDNERLTHESIDEAVEWFLSALRPAGMPPKVIVYGFARLEIMAATHRGDPLEGFLERLDEEHADPDGGCTFPTERMKEAERVFIEAVLAEYVPWGCEQVTEVEIDAMAWVREHRPDWLDENGGLK